MDKEKGKIEMERMTQAEVAKLLGVSGSAIQQTERRAFQKIRKYFASRNINPKDFLGE